MYIFQLKEPNDALAYLRHVFCNPWNIPKTFLYKWWYLHKTLIYPYLSMYGFIIRIDQNLAKCEQLFYDYELLSNNVSKTLESRVTLHDEWCHTP